MRDRPSDRHRTLTEREAGRPLGPDEVVHHKNEDKDDNSPENREVVPRGQHTAQHNKARGLSRLRRALAMPIHKERLY